MENPKLIEIDVLTGRDLNGDQLISVVKDYLADRVEYYDGCISVDLHKSSFTQDKSFWKVSIEIDDHIATDLFSSFGSSEDSDDEVQMLHQLVCFFRDSLKGYFSDDDEWAIYHDEFCDELCAVTYQEIGILENSLRTIIGYIFAAAVGSLKNILDATRVTAISDFNDDVAKDYQLTELHYLSFADYKIVGDSRLPRLEHLLGGLKESRSYNEFKEAVFPEIVREQSHLDFLASLKQIMDPIEKIRNSIAHNRLPSSTQVENYIKSRDALRQAILDFWEKNELEAVE